jgi:multiple sugar transport system substrate-binding protein
MEELTFSVLNHGQTALQNLQGLLDQFESQFGIRVRLEIIQTWILGWSRLVENALYRSGPDISEVGNTWIGDLARMDALQPYTQEEIIEVTKDVRIFNNLWKNRIRDEHGKAVIFSIPWTGDTRAVFFRKDLCRQAGIQETGAFVDTHHFEITLSQLIGGEEFVPLALTSQRSSLTIHNIASWIWDAGGDFLNPDGTVLTFDQPKALEGSKAYFRLGKYLGSTGRNLGEDESNQMFRSGRSAVTLSGYWMLDTLELAPVVQNNLGVTSMPGVPFVGGQDLVVWKHSRHKAAAMKLIQYLHSEEAARVLYPSYGLPVSESGWENLPFGTGFYPIFKTAIQDGRGFQGQLWGMVEKRLTEEYAEIWKDVLGAPDDQLDGIVESRLANLARRLQLSLAS